MKIFLLTALALTLSLGAPFGASASEKPVGLPELLLLGLKENSGLKAGRFGVSTARGDVLSAQGAYDLELFADGGVQQVRTPNSSSAIAQDSFDSRALSGEIGVRKFFDTGLTGSLSLGSSRLEDNSAAESLDPKYQATLGLELTQPLLRDAGRQVNRLALNLARGGSRQAEFAFLQQAQNLALGIEIGYYDLLKASSEEGFRREARELTETLLRGNRRKLETGLIPISEVQEAETALAGRELDLVLARQTREVQIHRLNGLINNRLPEELSTYDSVTETLPTLPKPGEAWVPLLDVALRNAHQSRPDLQIAAIEIEQSSLTATAARQQQLPRLDLNLQLQSSGLSGENRSSAANPYAGGWSDSFDSLASSDGYAWGAGLRFSYPLGNRSARAAYQKAEYRHEQARLSRDDLFSQVETELRERLTQVARLGELVQISTRFQELAEISFLQENRRLEEGLSDTFRILNFQEKMINARINRVAALIEYNKGLASLSYAMGSNLLRHGIVADLSAEEIRFDEN